MTAAERIKIKLRWRRFACELQDWHECTGPDHNAQCLAIWILLMGRFAI